MRRYKLKSGKWKLGKNVYFSGDVISMSNETYNSNYSSVEAMVRYGDLIPISNEKEKEPEKKQIEEEPDEEIEEEPKQAVTKAFLRSKTKDELNDFAVQNGIKEEINSYMTKKEMVETLFNLLK